MLPYQVKVLSENCIEIRMQYSAGFKQEFLLTSDVHFDNPKCIRKLYFRDLDEAVERKAGVITNGDFFCLMQGKGDPRHSKDGIRSEHNTSTYLDDVINDTSKKISPYADNFILFGEGNHCTSVKKRLETDPLKRLIEKVNDSNNTNIVKGGYQGYIKFVFHDKGARIKTRWLYYHHGIFGGRSSKGVSGITHHSSATPDADFVWTGHTHDRWVADQPRYRVNSNGKLWVEPQIHIKTGTYKEEYCQSRGFAVQKIGIPKALGGIWLTFEYKYGFMHSTTTQTKTLIAA